MDTNKNMFPEGYGIMEVRGLNAELIDVSVYTQQALEVMSQIALIMGEEAFASECASQAIDLKERINDLFWDKDLEIYCDFYGTREQALETTKGAIEQFVIQNTGGMLPRFPYRNMRIARKSISQCMRICINNLKRIQPVL